MTEQERKAFQEEMGYDPLWYMEEQGDIRQHFNWINRDSVEKVSNALKELEESHKS